MHNPKSRLKYWLMSLELKSRYKPEEADKFLQEVDLKAGYTMLDFGCGPGGYSAEAAKRVGEAGSVYALDIHPSAEKMVKKYARKRRLNNIHFIQSDCATGLEDKSVDVILLYDVFHEIEEKDRGLREFHRVLKPGAALSISDHHLDDDEIVSGVTKSGFFQLIEKGAKTHKFEKITNAEKL